MIDSLIRRCLLDDRSQDGQGLVEYALIIALVAVVLIAALNLLAVNVNGVFTAIGTALAGA